MVSDYERKVWGVITEEFSKAVDELVILDEDKELLSSDHEQAITALLDLREDILNRLGFNEEDF